MVSEGNKTIGVLIENNIYFLLPKKINILTTTISRVKEEILLGYEIKTGKKVNLRLGHTVVTGLTQQAGKTTTLMGLLKRSERKCVIFKTKIGEKAISEGTLIPPFFKDKSDWEFVISIIEASTKQKISIEKGTIMRLSAGTDSLLEILNKVKTISTEEKLRGIKEEIFTRLEHYLSKVVPEIQMSGLSKILNLTDSVNVIDVQRFSEEVQGLIIQSVLDEVLKNYHDVIVVMPEAWKFLPQDYNTPCKRSIESFIRQGATNGNYVFIDSQDIAGIDKIIIKQVSNWILGLQTEINEVKHTLAQLPIPKKSKPTEDDIMTLPKGFFYIATPEFTKKIYVLPPWLDEITAVKVAKGELKSSEVKEPQVMVPLGITIQPTEKKEMKPSKDFTQDLVELRTDFFNKIQEIQSYISTLSRQIIEMATSQQQIDENVIVSKVLQKMPMSNPTSVDTESIITAVLSRIPKQMGTVVYEVAPLEKLNKDFLEEAKQKVLNDIQTLSEDSKRVLKWLETTGKRSSYSELVLKCFLLTMGGSQLNKAKEAVKNLKEKGFADLDTHTKALSTLDNRIKFYLQTYQINDQEISNLKNHILMEMLK